MNRTLLMVVVGLAILAVIWLATGTDHPATGEDDYDLNDLWSVPVEEQASYERTVIDMSSYSVDQFPRGGSVSFQVPNSIWTIEGDAFIADFGTMQVHRYSLGGELRSTYGSGPGRAPGEILHIGGVASDNTKEAVFVLDGQANTLSIFDSEGLFQRRISFREEYWAVLSIPDRLILLSLGDNLFHHYDSDGNLIHKNGVLVDEQHSHGLNIFGWLAPSPNGGFIYVPRDGGYVFYFSAEGRTQRIVRTMDRKKFPFEIEESTGEMDRDSGHVSLVRGANVDEHSRRLYITTAHTTPSGRWIDGFIDAFDWDTGNYVLSYKLPFFTRSAVKYGPSVLAEREGSVVVLQE